MIRVHELHKRYVSGAETVPVLGGLSFDVARGEFVAVVGASGSGKSTLLQIIGGLDSTFDGSVEVAGVLLRGLGDSALAAFRNTTVGFVFQSFHLVPQMSALDNVRLSGFFQATPQSEEASRARAQQMLERVGLGSKGARRPAELSGGERQRVAIARALFARPSVLLCDEPTGNLDARTGDEIISLFQELHHEGLTLLVVTHEARMSGVADRILELSEGTLRPAVPRSEVRG